MKLNNLISVKTGKLDANAAVSNGIYPFFTCSRKNFKINEYAFDCECVLIAGNGDLNVKYYNGKFNAYQRTYVVTSKNTKELSNKFLYYFFLWYLDKLRDLSIGGVIKYIKLANITGAEINLPTINEQNNAIEQLDKLNECLDKLNKQVLLLDELMKSKFYEMFGALDLTPQFNDWVELGDITEIYTGTTPSTNLSENWDGNILWVTPAEIKDDAFYLFDTERKITEKGKASKSLNLMPIDTVLLTTRAPIGKTAIVGKPMTCNQGFKNFKCLNNLNHVYLYYLLKNNSIFLNSIGSGTTFLEISKSKISKVKIPLPTISEQNKFENLFNINFKLKNKILSEIKLVEELLKNKLVEIFGE